MHLPRVTFSRTKRSPRPWPTRTAHRAASSLAVAALLAAAVFLPAHAQGSPDSPWKVSGFGTLGIVGQAGGHDWGFLRNTAQLGATSPVSAGPDSRLGMQLNWTPGTRWEAGVQGVLLSKPSGTPVSESIEWAYLGYRPLPDTRVRIGRTSPDIFLFADSRNVGFALPWARPPVDFYGFAPLASLDGIDLEQRWSGADALWRARLSGGSVRSSVTDLEGNRVKMRGRDTLALGLTREQGGLLLKASYLRSRLAVDTGPGPGQLRGALDQLGQLPVPGLAGTLDTLNQNLWTRGFASYWALAAQYDTGPWTFTAEGSLLRVPNSPLSAKRAYVSAGYRHGDFTYYGVASRVRPDQPALSTPDLAGTLAPIIGPQGAARAQALADHAVRAGGNYRFDQGTVGVGLRWDFRPNAALKLQLDRFDVRRNGGAGWRFADERGAHGILMSVLVDFVWGQ